MTVNEHLTELLGLSAHDFPAPGSRDALPEAGAVAWRVSVDHFTDTERFEGRWQRFLDTVDPAGVRALIIGKWDLAHDSSGVIKLLVRAREGLTGLRAVFLGDVLPEEGEWDIPWLEQSDVKPLLAAYPKLRELGVRGGEGLLFPPVRHESLQTLTFQSGGLPAEVVRGLTASELPALERLEIWLGEPEPGGDTTLADLAPLLAGDRFRKLRQLGIQNSGIQDEIATAIASAPIVTQLTTLSLAQGTLTDQGAKALLSGQPLTHLQQLDLHHHYLSTTMTQHLRATLEPHGVELVLSGHPPMIAVPW